ncbi:hypothetical protein [Mucilaginibacter sp. PPCGB 2223]|uniref:hypothetical protein n=1 Tax=Mucilaginibacter sp. PPCGB 2223 TaxID=1886027 RepID=UPI0011127DEC|nr:hypothetical protein [Mucilaginibacter sp. PPCGB 2223]
MKAAFTFALIFCLAPTGVKAQTPATKNNGPFKTDSLTWHMPQTPNALNQLLLNKLTTAEQLKGPVNNAPGNALLVYSTMPVKHLGGNYKMPVVRPSGTNDKMAKQVTVVNPLAELPKP